MLNDIGYIVQKRTYMRTPITAEVLLMNHNGPPIKARAVNVSMSGIGVTDLSHPLELTEYDIELIPSEGESVVWLNAKLVYQDDGNAGFNRNIAQNIHLGQLVQAHT
jgi:hypothetical protein